MQIKTKLRGVLKDFNKSNREINKSTRELRHHSKKADDIYAMNILQPLLSNLPYLPFNGGALRPICMAYILNEIIINQREMVIEFGSGLSTIVMARLIKKNKLNTRVISIEHNENWASILQSYLENEGLQGFVEIVTVNLKETETPLGPVKWYDYDTFLPVISDKKFDLVIIDGPPADREKIKYSRFPALFKLENNLADDFCLMLDDANREGEQDLVKYYRDRNEAFKYTLVSETLAVFRKTVDFNPIPIYY